MNANKLYARLLREFGLRPERAAEGYFHWVDGDGQLVVEAPSVYVFRLSDLTEERWVGEARDARRQVLEAGGSLPGDKVEPNPLPAPCPFCNSRSTHLFQDARMSGRHVWCLDCRARGPVKDTSRVACKAWNAAK